MAGNGTSVTASGGSLCSFGLSKDKVMNSDFKAG